MSGRPPTEASLQRRLMALAKRHSFLAYKVRAVGYRGFPDVLLISPRGVTGYVEVKTTAGRLSPGQTLLITRMLKQGALVYLVKSMEDAALTIENLERY